MLCASLGSWSLVWKDFTTIETLHFVHLMEIWSRIRPEWTSRIDALWKLFLTNLEMLSSVNVKICDVKRALTRAKLLIDENKTLSVFALQTKIENLYWHFVCQVAIKQKGNNQLKRRIGNMKYVLADFFLSIMNCSASKRVQQQEMHSQFSKII